MAASEVELKLQLTAADLPRLRRHALVRSLKKGRPVTRRLHTVYFDTPEHALYKEGVTLRTRHLGRRIVQNVKTLDKSSGGLFRRSEWEDDIPGERPDPRLMLNTELRDLFSRPGLAEDLEPVFSTEVRRTTCPLGNDSWEATLVIDDGELVAGKKRLPICEVELELVRGDTGPLFELALGLQRDIPMRVSAVSKSDLGYALLSGEKPSASNAQAVVLSPNMTVAESFKAIARNCLRQIVANEPCVLGGDAMEGVHQMRVGVRRLRSALSVFRKAISSAESREIRSELRWLAKSLGPARDTDVFIAEVLEPALQQFPNDSGLRSLHRDFSAQRRRHYATARAAIRSQRFTTLLLNLGAWIETGAWQHAADKGGRGLLGSPARKLATAVLSKRDRNVLKAGRRFDSLSTQDRHILRLKTKQLRYAAEFFRSLFPGKKTGNNAKKCISRLRELQDGLGLLNDIAVARELLHEASDQGQETEHSWGAGLVAGWHLARTKGLIEDTGKVWKKFTGLPRFWA